MRPHYTRGMAHPPPDFSKALEQLQALAVAHWHAAVIQVREALASTPVPKPSARKISLCEFPGCANFKVDDNYCVDHRAHLPVELIGARITREDFAHLVLGAPRRRARRRRRG
jgi:hypothetical protein